MSSSISQAFKGLNLAHAESESDHGNIFDVSYQYLSKVRDFQDVHSFHNCLVALILMDRYHRAYQLLQEVGEDVHGRFLIEKLYIYYKLGKTAMLNALVDSALEAPMDDIVVRALKHIRAQNDYREGVNSHALELYHELIAANGDVDLLVDLACNERAIVSQANFMADNAAQTVDVVSTTAQAESTYDLFYNESLILLSQNRFDDALQVLQRAEALCTDQNGPEELLAELAPIRTTLAYVYQTLGEPQRAREILSSLRSEALDDSMIKLIVTNNYYSSAPVKTESVHLNLVQRELDLAKNLHHLQAKLTKPQYQTIVKNNLLLNYTTSTLAKTSSYLQPRFAQAWSQLFPNDKTPTLYKVLLRLGITYEELTGGKSDSRRLAKQVYKFILQQRQLPEVTSEFISAILLLVHLNHETGNYANSISILESLLIDDEDFKANAEAPCLAGLLIKAYEAENLTAKLQAYLSHLTLLFQEGGVEDKLNTNPDFYDFAKIIAFKLILINEEKAQGIFVALLKARPNDELVHTMVNQEETIKLESVENLTSSTGSIDDLLNTEIEDLILQRFSHKSATPTTTKHKKTAQNAASKVVKAKRAPKFSTQKTVKPNDQFDVNSLDKERWLPMRMRSYYKPSKKDKKKNAGHQGSTEPTGGAQKKKKKGKK